MIEKRGQTGLALNSHNLPRFCEKAFAIKETFKLNRRETYKEHLTILGRDRPEHVDVEASYKRVVGGYPVEIAIVTTLTQDSNRSLTETERLIKAAAVAALQ